MFYPPWYKSHSNQFVADCKEKRELSDSFFAKWCTLVDTGSNYLHIYCVEQVNLLTL